LPKNILVIDQSGIRLENTWPKRAKQLVKNNRAIYLNETTIKLIENMEGNMDQKYLTDILQKIDQLTKEFEDISSTMKALEDKTLSKQQLKTIHKVRREREKTYRRSIKQLRIIYDDQSGRSVRKSILKTARIAAQNGEKIDFEKLLQDIEKTNA
jgi:hypothetical protein